MSERDIKQIIEKLRTEAPDRVRGVAGYEICFPCLCGIQNDLPNLVFIIRGDLSIPDFPSSDAIEVSIRQMQAKVRYLTFQVTDNEYAGLFAKFCSDLLSVMDGQMNPQKALSRMAQRYSLWMSFWHSRMRGLSEEQARGLAGELLYLRKCLDEGSPAQDVVHGWIGPEGGDQDFVFADSWSEIKTIRQAASEVVIASLDQLVNPESMATSQVVDGRLVVYRLHSEPVGDAAFTLAELYGEICERLSEIPDLKEAFCSTVELSGADMAAGKYETRLRLQVVGYCSYAVNGKGFPRIIRTENFPSAVTKVRYSLSLTALDPWKIEE